MGWGRGRLSPSRVPAKHICVCFLFCAGVRPSSNPAWWPPVAPRAGPCPYGHSAPRGVRKGNRMGTVNSTCSVLPPRDPRVRRQGTAPKPPRVATALGPSVKKEISFQACKLWWIQAKGQEARTHLEGGLLGRSRTSEVRPGQSSPGADFSTLPCYCFFKVSLWRFPH